MSLVAAEMKFEDALRELQFSAATLVDETRFRDAWQNLWHAASVLVWTARGAADERRKPTKRAEAIIADAEKAAKKLKEFAVATTEEATRQAQVIMAREIKKLATARDHSFPWNCH